MLRVCKPGPPPGILSIPQECQPCLERRSVFRAKGDARRPRLLIVCAPRVPPRPLGGSGAQRIGARSPDGPSAAPRQPKNGPCWARRLRISPRLASGKPKTGPRMPKAVQVRPAVAPRLSWMAPRLAQAEPALSPRWAQDGRKTPPSRPKKTLGTVQARGAPGRLRRPTGPEERKAEKTSRFLWFCGAFGAPGAPRPTQYSPRTA